MMQIMATKLLTVTEAAAELGVSPSSLRRWTDAGEIHAIRLPGGARRYELAEVERYKREKGYRSAAQPFGSEDDQESPANDRGASQ